MMSESSPTLTHLDETGQVRMFDVGAKPDTARSAIAQARVRLSPAAYKLLSARDNAKGEVLNTARIAAILAAKRCAELIPLCHTLPLSFVGVDFTLDDAAHHLPIVSTCRSTHQTGVEMEAMMDCSEIGRAHV